MCYERYEPQPRQAKVPPLLERHHHPGWSSEHSDQFAPRLSSCGHRWEVHTSGILLGPTPWLYTLQSNPTRKNELLPFNNALASTGFKTPKYVRICSYVRSSTSAEVLASPQAGRSPIATWQAKMPAAWLVVAWHGPSNLKWENSWFKINSCQLFVAWNAGRFETFGEPLELVSVANGWQYKWH